MPALSALNELSASEAIGLLARREISAEELTRACLDRIAARESDVAAWQCIDEAHALAQARQLDRAPAPPLYGVPIGIKDIIDTADLPTEYGSPIFRSHRPGRDAACVAALRESGAVILGKTVTTELAYFTPGKTRNPNNLAHTPGGSSSGSAAAVADFMVPLALGSQTAGSIIRPASFCGVIGFKPGHGRFSMDGIRPLAPSLDTLGFFARSAADLPILWEALGDPSPLTSRFTAAPRIGFCRSEQWPMASEDAVLVLERSAEEMRAAGARVADVDLGPAFKGLQDAQKDIMAVEAAGVFRRDLGKHLNELGPALRQLMAEGDACSDAQYRAALSHAAACREQFAAVFEKWDVLLTPSAPGEAPLGLASTGDPIFNRVWTLLHAPCINLPLANGASGLPIGVQLVGPPRAEASLLAVASWILARLPPSGRSTGRHRS